MEEYVRREDILAYANAIRPCRNEYSYCGVAEPMILDKIREIANELEQMPYVEMSL